MSYGDSLQFYSQNNAGMYGNDASGQMGQMKSAYGQVPSMPAQFDVTKDAGYIGVDWKAAFGTGGLPGEPPLLEELGINFSHIWQKTLTSLNPFRQFSPEIMDDADLAGPLLFVLAFGSSLLLSGKVHFGFIYGVAITGCLCIYLILNLMSEKSIDGVKTASVLGYCLLPMVVLSSLANLLSLKGVLVLVLSAISVIWCTYSASTMFVTVQDMHHQRALVAYPVGLLYSIFAIMAVFNEAKNIQGLKA